MPVKIYDSAIGAFLDADTPLIWDEQKQAYKDSTGLVWNEAMQAWEERWGSVKLVPFSSATYEEIAAVANAYYNNRITLEQIKSVWSVGDMHSVNLYAMEATGVGESHRAQTVQYVILDFEHDELSTPINGHTKALISLGQKDCLMDATSESDSQNGANDKERGYFNSVNSSDYNWETCDRRKWCNEVYFNALPPILKKMIKPVIKISSVNSYNNSDVKGVVDKVFLPSVVEISNNSFNSYSAGAKEGTHYPYYTKAVSFYKNPIFYTSEFKGVTQQWWLRSLRYRTSLGVGYIAYNGSIGHISVNNQGIGIAPCLCI